MRVTALAQNNFSDISSELECWYQTDRGEYLLAQIREAVSAILDTSFGYHLLQIGPARHQSLFDQSTINHRIYASACAGGGVNLLSDPGSLPIESDSVDTLIAHHSLEFAEEPHQALREMQRVLTPQGKLIIIGFNPYSLLGVSAWVKAKVGKSPWAAHQPLSQRRVHDWLRLLGCPIESQQMFYSVPPMGGGRMRSALENVDAWVNSARLPIGGVYISHAIKQVAGIQRPEKIRSRRDRLIGLTVPKPASVPSPTPAQPMTRDRKVLH